MKLIKKISGLFGYKLIEKNHFKNSRSIATDSFLTVHNLLNILFEKKKIQSLVQIGANDGQSFDELNLYIKKYEPRSILVEPIKENFLKLKENYKNTNNIELENSAISIDNEISFLYKVDIKFEKKYDNHIPAIPSFNKRHLINHGVKEKHIVKEKINTINIKELLNKYNINKLDLFFVDAEGYDGKIVYELISNTNLRPFIIFEFIHIQNSFFEKLKKKLIDENYQFFEVKENVFCFPKDEFFFNRK
jgi:FkbM family methyltransferase